MIGVVACGSLYSEVEALAPEAAVRYVPPELHEFPASVPDPNAIRRHVQRRVDELDGPNVDRIVVLYSNSGDGLAGVSSTHAPLFVARVDDCLSLFLHGVEPETMGEPKQAGVYYLSRGWIDAGVDSYKLYASYLGEQAALVDRFEQAATDHPDLRVTWPDGDRYAAARDRGGDLSEALAGRAFHDVVGYYDRIKLIDTGSLYDVHYWYAGAFRTFVEELSAEYGDGHQVVQSQLSGDLGLLESLLRSEEGSTHLEVYPPGSSVE